MLSISHSARSYPRLPYEKMKEEVLGREYNLSLVFVGADRAQKLNKEHRGATYIPNVLSFPLTKTDGEIYITPTRAHIEAKKFDLSPRGYVAYLFIHGLLHLKGLKHGKTMDNAEKKYLKRFKIV